MLWKAKRSSYSVVVTTHTHHPRTGEARVGTLGVGGKPGLRGETQIQKQNKTEQDKKNEHLLKRSLNFLLRPGPLPLRSHPGFAYKVP